MARHATSIDFGGRAGRYRLEYRGNGRWVVGEVKVRMTGERAGSEYLSKPGDYSDVLSALLAVQDMVLGTSGAETVGELAAALARFRTELTQVFALRVTTR